MADRQDLRQRTKTFALEIIKTVDTLPKSPSANILGKQLLRCATAVGANYRAACRAQSSGVFLAKLAIVIEESDESMYWLELLNDSGALPDQDFHRLHSEANELTAIFVASRKTAQSKVKVTDAKS